MPFLQPPIPPEVGYGGHWLVLHPVGGGPMKLEVWEAWGIPLSGSLSARKRTQANSAP